MRASERFILTDTQEKLDGTVRTYLDRKDRSEKVEFTPDPETAAALMARKTRNAERWNIAEFGGPLVSLLSLQIILPTMIGSLVEYATNNQQGVQIGLGASAAETCLVGVGLLAGTVGLIAKAADHHKSVKAAKQIRNENPAALDYNPLVKLELSRSRHSLVSTLQTGVGCFATVLEGGVSAAVATVVGTLLTPPVGAAAGIATWVGLKALTGRNYYIRAATYREAGRQVKRMKSAQGQSVRH